MSLFGLCGKRDAGRTMTNDDDNDEDNDGDDDKEGDNGTPLKSGGFINQHYAEVGEREATNNDDHDYYDDAKMKTV